MILNTKLPSRPKSLIAVGITDNAVKAAKSSRWGLWFALALLAAAASAAARLTSVRSLFLGAAR